MGIKKFGVMWAWKVRGNFEGMWAWKVLGYGRGKCLESSGLCGLEKVLGKFGKRIFCSFSRGSPSAPSAIHVTWARGARPFPSSSTNEPAIGHPLGGVEVLEAGGVRVLVNGAFDAVKWVRGKFEGTWALGGGGCIKTILLLAFTVCSYTHAVQST